MGEPMTRHIAIFNLESIKWDYENLPRPPQKTAEMRQHISEALRIAIAALTREGELAQLLQGLVAVSPLGDYDFFIGCHYCGAPADDDLEVVHRPSCPYPEAVDWLKTNSVMPPQEQGR